MSRLPQLTVIMALAALAPARADEVDLAVLFGSDETRVVTTAGSEPESLPGPISIPVAMRPEVARPIATLGVEVELPAGQLPRGVAAELPPLAGQGDRCWPTSVYTWNASALHHRPLYFEEVNAERYGYTRCGVLQPAISTAHFFATIPALPYRWGAECPWECQYTLGHYRPGDCNPWRRHRWPVSLRGAALQAGVVTGLVFVLP